MATARLISTRCLEERALPTISMLQLKGFQFRFVSHATKVRVRATLDIDEIPPDEPGTLALSTWAPPRQPGCPEVTFTLPASTTREQVRDFFHGITGVKTIDRFDEIQNRRFKNEAGIPVDESNNRSVQDESTDSKDETESFFSEDDTDSIDPIDTIIEISRDVSSLVANLETLMQTPDHIAEIWKILNDIRSVQCRTSTACSAIRISDNRIQRQAGVIVRTDAIRHVEEAIGRVASSTTMLLGTLHVQGLIDDERYTSSVDKLSFDAFRVNVFKHGYQQGWFG